MKKSLILTALLSLSLPAQADTRSVEACTSIATFAQKAAQAYYRDVPLQELVRILNEGDNQTMSEGLRHILMLAYDLPGFTSERYQQREIARFQNRIFKMCLEAQ